MSTKLKKQKHHKTKNYKKRLLPTKYQHFQSCHAWFAKNLTV